MHPRVRSPAPVYDVYFPTSIASKCKDWIIPIQYEMYGHHLLKSAAHLSTYDDYSGVFTPDQKHHSHAGDEKSRALFAAQALTPT
jgi:hypothetical protein